MCKTKVQDSTYIHVWSDTHCDRVPDSITTSEATTAEEIFSRLSTDMLKAMFVVIYSSGINGAPSQPEPINVSNWWAEHLEKSSPHKATSLSKDKKLL